MTVRDCILTRRSTRAFKPDMPDKKDIESIVEAGLYAPSAMNEQTWRFTVVMNAQKLQEINAAVKRIFSSSDEERLRARSADDKYCCYYGAPVLIIVSCRTDCLFPAEDASCALENMFLMAHELGLGSCWINQLGHAASDHPALRPLLTELGVPSSHTVYGCAAIGYIAAETAVKPRRGEVEYII